MFRTEPFEIYGIIIHFYQSSHIFTILTVLGWKTGFLYIKCRMDSMEAGPAAVLTTPVVLRVSLQQGFSLAAH